MSTDFNPGQRNFLAADGGRCLRPLVKGARLISMDYEKSTPAVKSATAPDPGEARPAPAQRLGAGTVF
jgi:hypothetical protein